MFSGNNKEFTTSEWSSIIEDFQNAQSIAELAQTYTTSFDNAAMIGQNVPQLGSKERQNYGRFYLNNLPEIISTQMKKHFSQKLGPVTEYVLNSGQAVWLSDLLENPVFVQTGHDAVIQCFIDELVDGVCVPSYYKTQMGYGFISFGRPKEDFNKNFLWQIDNICQHAHVRYCNLKFLFQKKVKLTNRELDVVELIAMGKTNVEIALILGISVHTVSGYVKQIYLKLGVNDRVTITLRAISMNLIN